MTPEEAALRRLAQLCEGVARRHPDDWCNLSASLEAEIAGWSASEKADLQRAVELLVADHPIPSQEPH